MRCYLIDPDEKTVTEYDYNGDWKTIAPAIDAEYFETISSGIAGDCLFVDEEAAISRSEKVKRTFVYNNMGNIRVLIGKALYMGTDQQGDICAPVATIELVREWVDFTD